MRAKQKKASPTRNPSQQLVAAVSKSSHCSLVSQFTSSTAR